MIKCFAFRRGEGDPWPGQGSLICCRPTGHYGPHHAPGRTPSEVFAWDDQERPAEVPQGGVVTNPSAYNWPEG